MSGFALIVPAAGAATASTFSTLASIVAAVADQIGSYLSTGTSDTIPSGEPGRWVILDALRDDEQSRAQMAGGYIYVRTGVQAGSGRRILREGYEGPHGAVRLAETLKLSGTPTNLAAGILVDVTNPLPWRRVGLVKGLVECVREATRLIRVPVRLALTGNGTQSYNLSAYQGFTRDAQINRIYDWTPGVSSTDPPLVSRFTPKIIPNGATISLDVGYRYSSGEPFQVEAFMRADRVIYTAGGGWTYSTLGLVGDTDQTAAPLEWVLPMAMYKALQYLRRFIREDRSLSREEKAERLAETREQYVTWRGAAYDVTQAMPRLDALPNESMVYANSEVAYV
jgi:hypothetical protein